MSTMNQSSPANGVNGRRWWQNRVVQVCIAAASVLGLILVVYAAMFRGDEENGPQAVFEVKRGPLVISVAQSGTIQNQERVIVKSEVEGSTQILFLVDEGVHVNKDDLLIELDSSGLQDQKTQQQITVLNSEAAFIRARENLAVMKSQADSDIDQAKLTLAFARQDLTKYKEGEALRQQQQAEADITIADEELSRAKDKLKWSQELFDKGYVSKSELQADELAVKRAEINLKLARSAKALLDDYTHPRNLAQLNSDVKQAEEALLRTERKAKADLVQAEAELKAKESEHERQKDKLAKLDDQIAKCKIYAPVSGMVVYATTGRGSWRGNAEPLEEGQQVREREELIHLPTTTQMMAEVKVHEASLRKVKRGMPVRVTVDAVPGTTWWGRVRKIGLLPDAQSAWLNPDLKVYSTEIVIDGNAGSLKPGMTCLAEIIVEEHADALSIPVQCVVRVAGRNVVYLPRRRGEPEVREVQVGLDNNRMIHILDGLEEGDEVLLNPPLSAGEVAQESGAPEPSARPAGPRPSPASQPDESGGEPTTRPDGELLDPSKLGEMTREQRRAYFQTLTPEQREQLRGRMPRRERIGDGGNGSGRPGGGR